MAIAAAVLVPTECQAQVKMLEKKDEALLRKSMGKRGVAQSAQEGRADGRLH